MNLSFSIGGISVSLVLAVYFFGGGQILNGLICLCGGLIVDVMVCTLIALGKKNPFGFPLEHPTAPNHAIIKEHRFLREGELK